MACFFRSYYRYPSKAILLTGRSHNSAAPYFCLSDAPQSTSGSCANVVLPAPEPMHLLFTLLEGTNQVQLAWTLPAGYVAPVPEPSTWAMIILGFCGIGFVGYRRKFTPPSEHTTNG